jgi:hypothetical protein
LIFDVDARPFITAERIFYLDRIENLGMSAEIEPDDLRKPKSLDDFGLPEKKDGFLLPLGFGFSLAAAKVPPAKPSIWTILLSASSMTICPSIFVK